VDADISTQLPRTVVERERDFATRLLFVSIFMADSEHNPGPLPDPARRPHDEGICAPYVDKLSRWPSSADGLITFASGLGPPLASLLRRSPRHAAAQIRAADKVPDGP